MFILEIDCYEFYSFLQKLAHLHKVKLKLLSNMRIENPFKSV